MKVVLIETVGSLGNVGQVVNVKPGYARNFLFPQNKAVLADAQNLRQIEHQKKMLASKIEKAKSAAQKTKEYIESEKIIISKKAGENDKLFGSVTSIDVQKFLEEKGYVVSRKSILLDSPIKEVGEYDLDIKLDGDLMAKAHLVVEGISAEDEAE